MLVYAPGWSLPSQFEVIPPPLKKKLVFPRPKNENSPLKTGCARHFWKQISDPFFSSSFSAVFVGKSVTPMSTLANNERSCSKMWKKSGQNSNSIAFISCFTGEDFGTILSRRSRLSRASRAPSRLIRPGPIDCDSGSKKTMKTIPVSGQLFFRTSSKKVFSKGVRHLVLIYTPKEAHSQIFVTGRSVFARQMLKKFQLSWRGELVIIFVSRRPLLFICLVYIYISLNIYIIHHV